MGWKKKIEIGNTRNFADYHKVYDLRLNATLKTFDVVTQGYSTKKDKDEGGGPTRLKFKASVMGDAYTEFFENFQIPVGEKAHDVLISAGYALVKEQNPALTGAIKE